VPVTVKSISGTALGSIPEIPLANRVDATKTLSTNPSDENCILIPHFSSPQVLDAVATVIASRIESRVVLLNALAFKEHW
jgi:hypothetical protein